MRMGEGKGKLLIVVGCPKVRITHIVFFTLVIVPFALIPFALVPFVLTLR